MSLFVSELRKAHSVLVAHGRGLRSVPKISSATRMRVDEVAEWVTLLGLPVTSLPYDSPDLPVSTPPTFHQLNGQA